ncbi:metallophosphoesterase [Candidatus Woesearchaeota archaeon]|nr:metallophosphoesterase [Candidatus Woesearchaeota archaeon]
MINKEQLISYFMENGILISPDFFDSLDNNFDVSKFLQLFNEGQFSKSFFIGKDLIKDLEMGFQNSRVYTGAIVTSNLSETKQNEFPNILKTTEITTLEEEVPETIQNNYKNNVRVVFSYDYKNKKKEVQDFVNYFKKRYEFLKKILSNRQELQDSLSIARLPRKQEGDIVSVIGIVLNKTQTKNDNIRITLEDPTGNFDALITKSKSDLYNLAKDVVLDEVVGISGVMGKGIIFCNNLFSPDIPINHELKKSPDEVYTVFISDIHFGMKDFLTSDFMKFVMWLRGEYGNEQQRQIASKVQYLFVTGDVVEGVGIYPGQEDDLAIKDIYAQYEEATRYFKMIPERIKIIICGGNHDAMRMSEPQPIFDKIISRGFYEIPNMILVSNPAVVNIHSSDNFPGFDVLMYHGASFPYFGDNVPSIRDKGGILRCDLIMKFLLQRRHLAPSHSSTLYVPDETFDPLVIEKIPDIFVSGHIHQITVSNYRNVSLINSSCWVVQSEDNAKRGIIPHPAKIPIINLQTREIKIMNFLDDSIKVLFVEREAQNESS